MRKIALIGGDSRQIPAAKNLKLAGFTPFVYGNDMAAKAGFTAPYTLYETVDAAEAILLPIPSVKKNTFLFTPLYENTIALNDLLQVMPQNAVIFLWNNENCNIMLPNRIIDLAHDEIYLNNNARATAEAALSVAMSESKKAFFKMHCAILGYGRIGKILAHHLTALGAKVIIGARRKEVQKEAIKNGYSVFCPTDPILFSDGDLIFNTIPSPILTEDKLKNASKSLLYIELASSPGALNSRPPFCVIQAGGLPGKYCEESAGEFLAEAVIRHMKKGSDAVC